MRNQTNLFSIYKTYQSDGNMFFNVYKDFSDCETLLSWASWAHIISDRGSTAFIRRKACVV